MKPFLIATVALLSLAVLPPVAEAAKNVPNKQDADKKKQEQKAEREARGKKHEAIQAAMEAKDKNHDGSLTLDEYIAGEADAAAATKKFEQFNKNKDRVLSKKELAEALGL